jgi:plastocyanin
VDEHVFTPSQIRVQVDPVVSFVNSVALTHTIASKDASWTNGTMKKAEMGYVRFENVGEFTYVCEKHQGFVDS